MECQRQAGGGCWAQRELAACQQSLGCRGAGCEKQALRMHTKACVSLANCYQIVSKLERERGFEELQKQLQQVKALFDEKKKCKWH